MSGEQDQVVGKAKEFQGKVTGDKDREDEGKGQHAAGKIEHAVETEGLDIIKELKAGAPVSEIANKLLDQNGLGSIVKAISDLAGKVF